MCNPSEHSTYAVYTLLNSLHSRLFEQNLRRLVQPNKQVSPCKVRFSTLSQFRSSDVQLGTQPISVRGIWADCVTGSRLTAVRDVEYFLVRVLSTISQRTVIEGLSGIQSVVFTFRKVRTTKLKTKLCLQHLSCLCLCLLLNEEIRSSMSMKVITELILNLRIVKVWHFTSKPTLVITNNFKDSYYIYYFFFLIFICDLKKRILLIIYLIQ